MKQINIIRNGTITNSTSGAESEVLAWLAKHEAMGSFGKAAFESFETVEVSPQVLNEDGTEASPAVYEQQSLGFTPAEYTVAITDITQQLEQEAINLASLQYLASTDWLITRLSENGTAIPQAVLDQRAAARLAIVR